MPTISLPDGKQQHYDHPVTVARAAESIGAGLARAAVAGRVDGQLVDTFYRLERDADLEIVTARDKAGLDIIRHSTAHLLAQAVKELYPDAQVTIGPVVEDGFYYDFAYKRAFTEEDLEKIQRRMETLAKHNFQVSREVMARDEAIAFFRRTGEAYKAQIIAEIPEGEEISLYRQGEFVDLCRGPHVPSTGKLGAFKLTKVAGAYWRGDSRNEMLTRVYGTAWPDKKQLKAYLERVEEAAKRDHRRLGRRMGLFHMQAEAPGMVFWHPRGWQLYLTVENYIRALLAHNGYSEVHTPQLIDRTLWEKSGHWDKFGDMIFTTESENRDYAIKPMNCPAHVQIYKQGVKSYRDLPLRLSEFGSCHRNEPSGTLHGLMRARHFVQDDAHIFCTEPQIPLETARFIDLVFQAYRDFGFTDVLVKLSTRPEQRVGSDSLWDRAERALKEALESKNLDWELQPGEGAFYGPKVEFSLRDSLKRVWQLGTIQLDFSMPERLEAEYVDERGERRTPAMLHRAILGSVERFIGILIEEHAGAFPLWLAPVQGVVANITDAQAGYAREITHRLREQKLRVEPDLRNEKIGFKIREHTIQRVPYLLVVGEEERKSETVAVRSRAGRDLGAMSISQLAAGLGEEIASRGRLLLEG